MGRFSSSALLVALFLLPLWAVPVVLEDTGEGAEGWIKFFLFDESGKVVKIATFNTTNGSWNYTTTVDVPVPSLLFKDYWINGVDVDFPWGERKPIFVTQNPILLYLYDVVEGLLSRQQAVEGDVAVLKRTAAEGMEELSSLQERTTEVEERVGEIEESIPRSLLNLSDTPNRYREGRLLIVRDGKFVYVSPSALFDDDVGATNFLELTDTPSTYAGQAGKAVVVNPTEDGLTFATFSVTDEMVKADPLDPSAGYLDDKVDGSTLEVDTTAHVVQVKDGGITTAKIADGAVTSEKLADDAVTSSKIADGAVLSNHIADDSIYSHHIADGSIYSADIADGAIYSVDIADGSIYSVDIADGQVFSNDIADNDVDSVDIKDGTIVDEDISPTAGIAWSKISKAGSSLSDLGDVDSTMAPATGEALVWDGSQWTAQAISTTDEMVKADSTDPSPGYLSDKVDGSTIKVDTTNHWLYVDPAVLSSLLDHNDLAGLQGGSAGEYYHLTNAQYSSLTSNMPFDDGYILYSSGGTVATVPSLYYDAADDRIGIGTTAPTHKLHVSGSLRVTSGVSANSGGPSVPAYRFTNDGNTGMFNPSADNLAFTTGGSEAVRIDASGNVGIGTTTPAAKLHVDGGELWLFDNGGNVRFVIGDTPTTGDYGWLQWDSANDYFRVDTSDFPSQGIKVKGNTLVVGNVFPDSTALFIVANNTTEWMRVTEGGNVLLGNTSGYNVRLNVYAPQPMTAFRVEEEVDTSIVLFGAPYAYKMPITLSTATPVDSYSLLLNVSYQTGMRTDFGDLAFSWINPSTGYEERLPHWVENYVSGSYADVWVFIPQVSGGDTIYMYYGSPSVVDYGSPDAVFLYYDDFDYNKGWTPVGAVGTWSISGGVLSMWSDWGGCCNGGCVYNRIETPESYTLPLTVEIYFRQNPYTPYSNCGRTGPAVIYAGNGEVVTSTATTPPQGLALRMNTYYVNYPDPFTTDWHLLQVNFTTDSVTAWGDWMTTARTASSGTLPASGAIGLAGDTDTTTVVDEIDWIRVRRLGDVTYSFGTPVAVGLSNHTTLFVNESRVGINTETPTATLHVGGDLIVERVPATTGVDVGIDSNGRLVRISSSQRYKEDIRPLDIDSSAIYDLEPKAFRWKSTGEEGYGLIAEEVEDVIPEMVIYQNNSPEAVDYRLLTMLMLEEMKRQREEIEALKARVEELEGACGTGQQ